MKKRIKKERFKNNEFIKWKILFLDDEIYSQTVLNEISELILNNTFGKGSNLVFCNSIELKKRSSEEKVININDFERDIYDYDLILTDIWYEEGKSTRYTLYGKDVLLPLIRRFRNIKIFPIVIMLSRIPSHEIAHENIKEGADYYLSKKRFFIQLPISLRRLIEMLYFYFMEEGEIREEEEEDFLNLLKKFLKKNYGIVEEEFKEIISKITKNTLTSRTSVCYYVEIPMRELHKILHRFIKVSTIDKIYSEKYNYEKYIKGNIDNFCGRIEEEPVILIKRDRDNKNEIKAIKTLIAYTPAGYPEKGKEVISMVDFMKDEKNLNKINSVIDFVFDRILYNLHKAGSIYNDDIRKYYRKFFPPITVNLVDLKGDFIVEERDLENKTLKIINRETGRTFKIDFKNSINERYKEKILYHILIRKGKILNVPKGDERKKEKDNEYLKAVQDGFYKKIKEIYNLLDLKHEDDARDKFEGENLDLFGNKIINPVFYFGLIDNENTRLSQILKTPHFSIIHGDLQPENILLVPIEKNSVLPWLIDFGETGKGHIFHDYAKLELQIRLMIISDVFHNIFARGIPLINFGKEEREEILKKEIRYLLNFERKLLGNLFEEMINLSHLDEPFSLFKEIGYYYSCLNRIQIKAKEIHKSLRSDERLIDWDMLKLEYLLSLYYLSLNSLKYNEEINPEKRLSAPLPRILSILTSAVALERFLNIVLKKAESESPERNVYIEFLNSIINPLSSGTDKDNVLMRMALILSRLSKREGKNRPKVGAIVLDREGKIISLSSRKGDRHAEYIALNKLEKEQYKDGTIYTTLEPCFYRNTKNITPCCYEILDKEIGRVVIGCPDNNPVIKEKGFKILRGGGKNIDKIISKNKKILAEEIANYTTELYKKLYSAQKRKVAPQVKWHKELEEEIKKLNIEFFAKER